MIFNYKFVHGIISICSDSNTEYIQILMPYCIELAMLTFTNIKYVF